MDRLPTLIASCVIAVIASSCDDGKEPVKSNGSRVDAVVAKTAKIDLAGFCDVSATPTTARTMVLPDLAGPAPKPAASWRWINVWATWCRPCVDELPLLARLQERFAPDHLPLELLFLSVDASAADVTTFRQAHPDAPEGMRIKDSTQLTAWLRSIGLDENSALPIHIFVDDDAKIRCVRMGAIEESHYDTVRGLVRAG